MKATFRYLSFCKVIILIQITILILNSCTCDRIDNRKIKVINESMSDIVWLKSSNKAFRKPKYNQDIDSVSIDSIGYISNIVPTWNELIEESKDKKIAIFIINNDSLKKYDLLLNCRSI